MGSVETMVQEVNSELKPILGYDPYFVSASGKLSCSACHTDREPDAEELKKTKNVKSSKGEPMAVHVCPGCKYAAGVNVSLKKRIDAMRKSLELHDFPIGDKFRNDYSRPISGKYRFIIPETSNVCELTDQELCGAIDEMNNTFTKAIAEAGTTVEDDLPEELPAVEASEELPLGDEACVEDDEVEIDDEDSSSTESDEGFSEEDTTFFDDEDDLTSLFGNNEDSADESDEVLEDNAVYTDSEEDSGIDGNPLFDLEEDDSLDDWFAKDAPVPAADANPIKGNYDSTVSSNGVTDVKHEGDKLVEDMIKANLEEEEDDVFRIDTREGSVASLVRKSRINDLLEIFNDSNAKTVVDRVLGFFRKMSNRQIRHLVTINDLTHECPVVDFEGNIRLIFVDLDVIGGKYDLQSEINGKLRPAFEKTSEFELMTFVIYSDMIERGNLHRVIKAIAKHIAFNLKIAGIFTPISVVSDSDRYFYTTDVLDKNTIANFSKENCAGNHEKPATGSGGEIALISQWNSPDTNPEMLYSKEIRNRITIANGGDVGLKDLSMRMTCSLRYILLPMQADGSINVTIVEYTEALDLYVRDGLGVLIGALVYNIKSQHPQSKLKIWYEFDTTMIPSPTVSRYLKSGAIRPIIVNHEFNKFNKLVAAVANQNDAKVQGIPVEGEIFDAPEYNASVWRTYNLVPEQRRNATDNKRIDWRYLGKKSIVKTLGDRFKSYGNVDVSDRKARAALLEKIGYQPVIQPQIAKLRVTDDFGLKALQKVMQTSRGVFSINQYIQSNRSQVVDDNYMNNTGAGQFGSQFSGSMTPEQIMYQQQMRAYQQQMMQQQMYAQTMGWSQQ